MESNTTNKREINIGKIIADNTAFFSFAILFILASLFVPQKFLALKNLLGILRNNTIIGIIALGMTLLIIMGDIDLSVGSNLALVGLLAISTINSTGNIFLGVALAIALSITFNFLTGFLVAKAKIPAFIVTLGTMTIYRSISQHLYHGGGIQISPEYEKRFIAFSNFKLFNEIHIIIIFWIFLTILLSFFMKNTATGRYIYALGSNEKATKLSGINVDKVKIVAFMISGAMVGIASMVEGSRLGSMNSAASGTSYEMDAIASVVIGGTSMSGGRGTILGTFFGTLTLGIINNMMNLLRVPPFIVGAVKGGVIIAAVLFQRWLDRKKEE